MKSRDIIALVVGLIIVFGGGSYFVASKLVTSKEELASNVAKSVETQNSQLFLAQFDRESKVSRFADIGAKSVLKDWKKHATISDKEIGQRLVTDRKVSGSEYDYQFSVQKQTRFLFFKSYYLSAGLTRLKPDANSKKSTITLNKKSFKNRDFEVEFFPGTYSFYSELKQDGETYTNDYDYTLTGDPASFAFDFEFDTDDTSETDSNSDTDSSDEEQPGDTDKAYATMNDSEYESNADDIGDKIDKTYGDEQKNYSSYDDSQYPDYQGNTK